MCTRLLLVFGILILFNGHRILGEENVKSAEVIEPVTPNIERSSNHHPPVVTTAHHHDSPTYQGFWKKKFVWRPRWVKTWQEKKIYIAVWKRMWGPAIVNEWVPVPKPPPGWLKHDNGNLIIKGH